MDEMRGKSMNQIRLMTVAYVMISVWVLHATMPQQNILFIPASTDEIKIRPAGQVDLLPAVVSLEEADKRYKEKHGHELPDPYADYQMNCWFDDCELELLVKLASYEIMRLFKS
jgi:hypothetical protein